MRGASKLLLAFAAAVLLAVGMAACGGGDSSTSTATSSTAPPAVADTTPTTQKSAPPKASGEAKPKKVAKASSNSAPLPPPPTSFTTHKLTPAQGSQLAGRGETTILVRVGGPGEVSAFGQAQLDKGIERVATTPSKTVSAPGLVRLPVRLTPPARAWLAAGKDMTVYFGVYFSKTVTGQRLVAHLKG